MSKETDDALVDAALLDLRAVSLTDEVTMKQCRAIATDLVKLQVRSPTEPAKLLIMSQGGDTRAAMFLADVIDHILTIPVHGVVVGYCQSAATRIYLSCTRRLATPSSYFVIHSGAREGIGFRMDDDAYSHLEDLAKETETLMAEIIQLYQNKLGLSKAAMKAILKRGDRPFNYRMDAQEAKKIGLVHEILTGKAGIFTPPTK